MVGGGGLAPVQARVTLLDFRIPSEGLEGRLLGMVVAPGAGPIAQRATNEELMHRDGFGRSVILPIGGRGN